MKSRSFSFLIFGSLLATSASVHAETLFVSNPLNNTIVKFTPGGVGSVFASAGLSTPTGIAFDSTGNLYSANDGNNTILKFTPSGIGSVFASVRIG